jgi:uncharacterized 2Fe-2S/4Fe-4S cluster protein (DUF4445 family)
MRRIASSPGTVVIDLQPIGRRIETARGTTLLAAAQAAGVELQAICGGAGTCGGCRVRVAHGAVAALSDAESVALSGPERADGLRLACQATALGNVRVDIPPESLTAAQRLQLDGEEPEARPFPPSVPTGRLGLAIDIGTTKLALFLVDLDSGLTLARRGAMNPQIAYGEDVISRIAYAGAGAQTEGVLRRVLLSTLNRAVSDLCGEVGVVPESIAEAVVVGNTVMHHLFSGLPVRSLGVAPYRPATTEALELEARPAGLALAPGVPLYLPPLVAGFVGADHVATLLACGMGETPRPTLAIDIGTNTEISLAIGGRLLSCSSPSGPAFEGAHITAGMRAAPGAIERVHLSGGAASVYTIDRMPPIGVCGSGILDAVSEMLRTGLLDRRGNIGERSPARRAASGPNELLLAPAAGTGHGRDIAVTRGDVNEIQLAKAAVRAGIEVLLADAGAGAGEIEQVLVAGAFGSYLDLASAVRIGLLPRLPLDRFRQVGNAAGAGARRMLTSPAHRRAAEALARRIEYVELTAHPAFHRGFVTAMEFEVSRRR